MNSIEPFIEDAGNVKFRSCFRDSMYAVLRKKDKTGLFGSVSEIFYTAFAIGYHFNKKTPLSKKPINHVNLVSFDRDIKELMVMLILKKNPSISKPKELWSEVEQYAEYGIQVLYDNWKEKNVLDINSIIKSKLDIKISKKKEKKMILN